MMSQCQKNNYYFSEEEAKKALNCKINFELNVCNDTILSLNKKKEFLEEKLKKAKEDFIE